MNNMKPTDTIGDDVTLYREDALQVLPNLSSHSFDAVITDPPYGTGALAGGYGRQHVEIENDSNIGTLIETLPLLGPVLAPNAWAIFFCAAKNRHEVNTALLLNGFYLFGEIVWDKGMPGLGYHIRYSHETAVVCRWGNPKRPNEPLISVFRHSIKPTTSHPHEKPTVMMKRLVQWACPAGGRVLDPFMGSGSTVLACLQTGRKAAGIELDTTHYATALRRLTHGTGAGQGQLFTHDLFGDQE